MQILLLGRTGQVGSNLYPYLSRLGYVYAPDSATLNLVNLSHLRNVIKSLRPQLIVNAAGYTNVNRAEIEPELTKIINSYAPTILAEEAQKIGATLIHYSTDYVFNGENARPYQVNDQTHPLNVYGESKLKAEEGIMSSMSACLILRTSWVYNLRHANFVSWILTQARRQKILKIVADQTSSPTSSQILAQMTNQILQIGANDLTAFFTEYRGVYHLSCLGSVSRLEWAQTILGLDPNIREQIIQEILPAKNSEFQDRATRPAYSALDCSLTENKFGIKLPGWLEALKSAMHSN